MCKVCAPTTPEANAENDNYLEDLRTLRKKNRDNIIAAHLNINSMKSKIIMVTEMLYEKLVDILQIGESKLDESYSDAILHVDGYRLLEDRTSRGGGVMAYVHSDIQSRRRKDSEPELYEAISMELQLGDAKWLMIATNHPPSHHSPSQVRPQKFSMQPIQNDNMMVIGDLNFDALRSEKCIPLNELCDIFDIAKYSERAYMLHKEQ